VSEERARPETRAYAGAADAVVAIDEVVSVQIKSNFWHSWTQVAIRHEQEARRARAKLVAGWGASDAGIHMPEEMQASMVSLVAVAFALDALHFEVAPLIGRSSDPRDGGGSAWGYQLDTFRLALPGVANKWQSRMEWLADVRRDAVHAQPVSRPPRPHPGVPTNTADEYRVFSSESATRAVDFLMEVLRSFFKGSRGDQRVLDWGRPYGPQMSEFEAVRKANSSADSSEGAATEEP
jgi:hypothetical protein